MMQMIGFILICFAGMTADSESLVVPAVLLVMGAMMVMTGRRRDGKKDS